MLASYACRLGAGCLRKSPTWAVGHVSRGVVGGGGIGQGLPIRQFYKKAGVESFAGVRSVWRNLFGKYLLATNTLSSGLLMVAGDLVAQEIERRGGSHSPDPDSPFRYDMHRVGRMFIVGALQGPLHHYVYQWMDKVMPVRNTRNTLTKILIDQVVMSPLCIFMFFYSACFLERKTLRETNAELSDKFAYIYLFDWMVWPAAQYVNFRYLDSRYRVMFVNVCTALYNIFMSYMKHDFTMNL